MRIPANDDALPGPTLEGRAAAQRLAASGERARASLRQAIDAAVRQTANIEPDERVRRRMAVRVAVEAYAEFTNAEEAELYAATIGRWTRQRMAAEPAG